MKIAHVVASLPPDIGGMGRVAYDEANYLSKLGHDVTVFTLSYFPHQYSDEKLPFKIVRAKPFIRSGVAGLVPNWRSAFRDFDLVHLHYPFYGGAEWVWFSQKNYVVTYHMDAAPTAKHRKLVKNVYDRLFARRILQKAKRVIVVDERHFLADRKFLFPDQSTVIHNGVDTEIFKRQESRIEDLGLDNAKGKVLFLFVGNLLPIKGLSTLLNAWKKIDDERVHLAIVGGGFNEHYYREEAKKLKITNITWLGACHDQAKMAQYYSVADAVVVPSLSESFSLVSIEALSSETPVVASALPGISEKVIAGETGLTFEAGNEHDLQKAINEFLKIDPTQRKLIGENGRKIVLDKFSMQRHVEKLLALYREVL